MNENTPDASQDLSALLDDVRRHLLWQEEAAGRVLMIDAKAALELQRSGPSLRERFARTHGAPDAAPAPQAPRAEPPPPRMPTVPEARPAGWERPVAAPQAGQGATVPARMPPPAEARPPVSRPLAAGMLVDAPPRQSPPTSGPPPGASSGERPTLDEIRRDLGDCRRCKLCTGRKNLVFGSGNPRAELVFVGEGPGENEDLQGVPFVGAAGELLTKMIGAMGYRRDDVYICNVVKCRPPGNRNPEPEEIAACEPFLRAQLAAIQPKVVVALGKFAAQTLLRDSTAITRLRGNWRTYEGIQLMPTFHPAYLLRSPAEKRKAWEDLQAVMKVLGKQPGSRA
ncbi:Uracil-DNA glycosylase, family 4 [Myxococcus hansupus]|uniref:Type-4 uracil-DNA glycosylase n=1 Tax=Pseudomyxococcus hansupus TaxID=1297742 RepID=A0A0H4XCA4_9BACT|nr:uracil-DNA glycosylase [Myxococcus hansupus]AKQ65597.1 Uracil-DNA glycosylase, family 4 [Myxococcus hansupus]